MLIGIIPARKNSKRIKNKNIKIFIDKPIIAWTIKSAFNANIFDKIVVSTDCDKIAAISEKFGAEINFIRPKNLADDYSTLIDVMSHATSFYDKKNYKFSYACLLMATAPFLSYKDLRKAYNKLKKNYDYVLSITEFDFPIQRALKINNKSQLRMLDNNSFLKRSQDLKQTYHDAGQFCFGKVSNWIKKKNIFKSKTTFIEIDKWKCQDIDTLNDWKKAEKLFELNKKFK